jgi:arginase family enzyme
MHPFREYEMAYAGVGVTFCRTPLVLDPAGLAGVDVAIVGAPFDLGTSFRPGARFGPRAIRMAEDVGGPPSRPSMELGLDPFGVLRVVDHGDCTVFPEIDACHAALQRALAGVLAAGAVPVVLGGDHSLSLPHPLHRRDAHLDGFGNHGIDAAWSLRSFICLEQDTGMGEPAGRRRAACDGLLEK